MNELYEILKKRKDYLEESISIYPLEETKDRLSELKLVIVQVQQIILKDLNKQ